MALRYKLFLQLALVSAGATVVGLFLRLWFMPSCWLATQYTFPRAKLFRINTLSPSLSGLNPLDATLRKKTGAYDFHAHTFALFCVLRTKCVLQLLWNQRIPHSFRKLPGVTPCLPAKSPFTRNQEKVPAPTHPSLNVSRLSLLAVLLLVCPALFAAQSSVPSPAEAIALEQQGKLAEAERVWLAVVAKNPRDAAAYASLGVDYAKEQKYPEAASAYRKALALDPKLSGIQLNLGLAEFKQGHFAAAIAPLKAALGADPSSMQALTLLGLSCYGAGRFADASEHLAVAAKADPANVELHQVLAQSCLWAKNYSCALDEFKSILQHNPDSPAAHMLTGEALDGLRRTPEAIAEFEEAVKAGSQEPNVHFGLGYLHWELKQYDEAEAEFKKELAIDPDHAQASAYLGDIAFKNNDLESAVPLLKKARQSRKDIRIVWLDMGAILGQQGHHQEAIASLKRAIELDPEQPDAHFRLGRVYQAMGNQTAAQKEFEKVRALHEKAEEDLARKMSTAPPALPKQE